MNDDKPVKTSGIDSQKAYLGGLELIGCFVTATILQTIVLLK